MLTLKKVAVTGGLASGKSSVCSLFRKLGAYVVSADEVVHHLLSPETSVGKQVIALIGKDIVNNGTLDRALIAKRVFNKPSLLRSLEELIHPAVRDRINEQYEQEKKKGTSPLFVAEIPLLYESKWFKNLPFDAAIAVVADEAVCKKRYPNQDYDLRMNEQMPPAEKAALADYVIRNNGSIQELEEQVINLFKKIINL